MEALLPPPISTLRHYPHESRWASVYPRERIVAHERTAGGWHGRDHESHAGGLGTFEPLPGMQTVLVTMCSDAPALFNGTITTSSIARARCRVFAGAGAQDRALYLVPRALAFGHAAREGWRETLRAHGIELPRLIRGDWTAQSGYAAGRLWRTIRPVLPSMPPTTPWPTAAFAGSSRAEGVCPRT